MEFHHIIMLFFSTFGFFSVSNAAAGTNLFREYIGAESAVHFSAVPINSGVEFHFILAFAIDYTTTTSHPTPTNGNFNPFWNTDTLTPTAIAYLKSTHPNARVAVSLGGDTVTSNQFAYFSPTSTSSWVTNAAASLTQIIQHYNLDGIDIDYEHFNSEPNTFADCIGQLVQKLKRDNIISFASIAPYEDDGPVQRSYMALWRKYGDLIDYVNFQFYAYDKGTSVQQFLQYFESQRRNYNGGQLLASFISDGSQGLGPEDGFFDACGELKRKGWLGGIFVWCADESQKLGFKYEKQAQQLLASS